MLKLAGTMIMLGALLLAAPGSAAPDARPFEQRLDSYIEGELAAQKVPGIAVAVLQKGKIVVAKGYGLANVEHNVPVTPDTIFQTGSVGKMFTTAAVMTQAEQGRIGLDDPITKYFTDAPASWRPITVRHLMTHTSGIPDYGPDFDYRRDYTDDELGKAAYALPLDYAPGKRWNYCNRCYALLGILVKKATGRSYLEVLDTEVFKPLGMLTARGISDADIVPYRASGYRLLDGKLKNQDWVSPTMNSTADGSLYVSLNDMIAWARGVEDGKVLSAAGWKQVYTPVKLNSGKPYPYGFGWSVEEAAGHPRYHHGGAWQGFRTFYSRYLRDGLSIIVLTNSASAKPDAFADGIAKLWDPALVTFPRPKPEPAVDRRVTALIEKVRHGKLEKGDLPLAPEYAELSRTYFTPLVASAGPLTKLELTRRREKGDDTVYNYTAMFGDERLNVEFAVGPGGQASTFMISK